MGFAPPGVSKLSELEIDIDKDWAGKGINNLKELALGMQKGDIFFRLGDVLVKLSPGSIGDELTSHGSGHAIDWGAPPAAVLMS